MQRKKTAQMDKKDEKDEEMDELARLEEEERLKREEEERLAKEEAEKIEAERKRIIEEETDFFLKCQEWVSLLFLGCTVLFIGDVPSFNRFWLQYEALLSMRTLTD